MFDTASEPVPVRGGAMNTRRSQFSRPVTLDLALLPRSTSAAAMVNVFEIATDRNPSNAPVMLSNVLALRR